jgi:carbohydrate diacid regulator
VCDAERAEEVFDVVNAYEPDEKDISVVLDDNQVGFVKFFRDEDTEYRSFNEYAEFLYQSILEETGMHVYITLGAAVSEIGHIPSSFSQALSAYRMKDSVNLSGNVHSFKEYVFTKIIEDLPKPRRNEYLDLLLDSEAEDVFTDKEMIQTAEVFLENNLNVSETSRKLFLHRNTLTYRLDKIERQTGLDIRKFSDAVTFRLITVLYKQGKK